MLEFRTKFGARKSFQKGECLELHTRQGGGDAVGQPGGCPHHGYPWYQEGHGARLQEGTHRHLWPRAVPPGLGEPGTGDSQQHPCR